MWFQTMWHIDMCESDENVQPPFKLRNSKWCSVSNTIFIEYSSDKQRLWSDCAYAQAGLSLCWSHIPHCWKFHVVAQIFKDVVVICRMCDTILILRNLNYVSPWKGRETYCFSLASVCLYARLSVWLSVTKLCPLYNSKTVRDISTKLHTSVKQIQTTMSNAQEP